MVVPTASQRMAQNPPHLSIDMIDPDTNFPPGTRLSDIDRRERRDEEEEDRWWSWWWLDQELRWREARRREYGEDL